MSSTEQLPETNMGSVICNTFGECALFAINRNLFQNSDASTVFRSHFDESLFEEDSFYIIAGTDSGLLYRYVKSHGVPKGSHYLFVELPQVLQQLNDIDTPDEGISVTDGNNWQERANDMDMMGYAIHGRLVLRRSLGVIHGHYSEYWPFWRRIKDEYTAFQQKQQRALSSQPFTLRQIENLSENQIPAICLKGTFRGKTAVVLAGGPSLHELLPWVQQQRQNLLVIAVSRISRSLLQANIQPDVIVSVDPYPINLSVSQEMLEFQDTALLLNEYHLSSNLLSSWGGKKIYLGKRFPWSTPLNPENLPPTTGYTVTNAAINFALETGVQQIVLGGVDFCFSQEGYTHASGSAEHAMGFLSMNGNKHVTTNSGRIADSDFTFMASADALDVQAQEAEEQGCLIINPAPDAMRLPHVKHQSLQTIDISPLEKPARETITDNLPASNIHTRTQLYRQDLAEVDRVLNELREIKELARKGLKYNQRLFDEQDPKSESGIHIKLDKIEKQFNQKYTDTTRFMKFFGIYQLIPVIRHSEQYKEDTAENNRLYYQAMRDISNDLITILQDSRHRIRSRQEEDAPQPDMPRLFEQWRKDQQPGRAVQWAQHHPDIVAQLPPAQQQELRAFQDLFDEHAKKLARLHFLGIAKDATLDGLNAKAKEFFQCQDEAGLARQLSGLKKYREPEHAKQFIPLVQGYLAELRGKPEDAISAYQEIVDGPAQMDALMRLFELHTKAEDLAASLAVLKTLSALSSTYSPLYADLLQATGDIDTAITVYTDYLLANPDDLNSMMKLGHIFHQLGATDGVDWTMNYILGKDPDNETAKALLRSLEQPQVNDE